MGQQTRHLTLAISGMSCASCALHVEKALRAVEGVAQARVNLATHLATVEGTAPLEKLCAAVQAAGYGASPLTTEAMALADDLKERRRRLIASALFTTPVFILGMSHLHFTGSGLSQLVLTTPVLVWAGREFFANALRQLRHGVTNMDTLIAMGSATAYTYSVWAWLTGQPLYFETAGVIITLILLGRYLEAQAKGRASAAIRKLMSLQPRMAHVIRGDAEVDLPTEQVQTGDLLLVRPGESFPVDGVVVEGESTADEALISGESTPVEKHPGSPVIGATLNGAGSLKVRAEKVGADTVLARIVRLVAEAQGSKAPVQRLADRVAGIFVPAVLLMALLTAGGWFAVTGSFARALGPAIAVLIIACPCALGLATPTAITVALGRAAERGILIRDAASIERIESLDVIMFDKTGTLTYGRPAVQSFTNQSGLSDADFLGAVAACERLSEHPLARAIVQYAQGLNVPIAPASDFQALPGRGARALVQGRPVLVGSERFLKESGVNFEPVSASEAHGRTRIFVAWGGRLSGWLDLADPVRPSAAAAVKALGDMQIDAVLLTGDRQPVAEAVARELGIDQVGAELLPEQKIEAIRSRQRVGQVVGMVGDGINDAPALAAADVGFALGTGADIAMEAAPVTLVKGDLTKTVEAIRLSRRTMRIIRQNLWWAFGYNALALPLAALGLLHPMIAAAAMSASSVSVVLNSLRLRRFSASIIS